MDCRKVGELILKLRKEKGLTQKQLARTMNLSDKTISKWERGFGCPDVSLLRELSAALGVNVENLLAGTLEPNDTDGGNMKRIKFYTCPDCGNILTATGDAEISCCGRKLAPMAARPADEEHRLKVEKVEDDFYITFTHPMTKEHYLNFLAYAAPDRVLLVRLYPEQGGEVRMAQMHGGRLYYGCNRDGLWMMDVR